MSDNTLERLERIIYSSLPSGAHPERLAKAAKKLSDAFTIERGNLPRGYMSDPDLRSAYLAHFVLTNAAKVVHCLTEADDLGLIPKEDRLNILDIGCGPGTASLAASLYFADKRPELELDILGIEESPEAAKDARSLFGKIGDKEHHFEVIIGMASHAKIADIIKSRSFDIIIAANFLNELKDDEAMSICRKLIENHLDLDGIFIIIDPALRETTRPLMHLRDKLISDEKISIVAPCLHQCACPMLTANERDWCHFYIEWQRPELIEKMDKAVGTDHEYLKMAYLMLGEVDHDLPPLAPPYKGGGVWRVVSSPLISKGKRELVLCGANGELKRIMRVGSDRSELNAQMDSVKRGDVVECTCDRRAGKKDRFSVIRKF